ncbi:uncharacterized protein LOC141864448 isoform X5 [Acropora palmata]|uniref:uncharacterized protein LOC141864448 isoform X5 n=1 Tax=Acropora palmata TaxID=6131 RepID=UPI003DA16FAC
MGQELRDYKVHGSLKFATFPLSFLLRILNICAEHAANGQVEALLIILFHMRFAWKRTKRRVLLNGAPCGVPKMEYA